MKKRKKENIAKQNRGIIGIIVRRKKIRKRIKKWKTKGETDKPEKIYKRGDR